MNKKIEIIKTIIEIDESKTKDRARVVMLDKEGNRYYERYYDISDGGFKGLEIICEEVKKTKKILKKFDRKMLKTKGENPDVACYRSGYNARIKEEWEIIAKLSKNYE